MKRKPVYLYWYQRNRLKYCKKRQKGQYVIIKGWIQEEDTMYINIYTPHRDIPKYIKQI